MLWLIIFGAIGFALGAWLGFDDGIVAVFTGALGALLGVVLAFAPNGICAIWVHSKWERVNTQQLQSIATGDKISGRFFLGSGVINDELVYNYFVKTPAGSYYETYAPVNESTVYETDGQPRVETWRSTSENIWLNIFADNGGEAYEFYVPNGSVVQTYTLKP